MVGAHADAPTVKKAKFPYLETTAPVSTFSVMKCMSDDLEMEAMSPKGESWHYCGSRQDVENWFNQWPGTEKMSVTVRDRNGIVVGRKVFGEGGITWGISLSE